MSNQTRVTIMRNPRIIFICISFLVAIGLLSINAAAAGASVGSFAALTNAIASCGNGDTISITNNIVVSAEIAISAKGLTIEGNNYSISVPVPGLDASGVLNASPSAFRVFNISVSGKTNTLQNMTVVGGAPASTGAGILNTSGTLVLQSVTVAQSGGSSYGGGGVVNSSGTIFMRDCNISRNAAHHGGGFLNTGTGAKLFIERCTFSENRSLNASGGGGAGENQQYLYANNSTFANNKSTELGGAINNYQGTAYCVDCTFVGNIAYGGFKGGGIAHNGGTVTLVTSLFTYNYCNNSGTYALDDINNYSGTAPISYYSVFQSTTSQLGSGSVGTTSYSGNISGANDSLFCGGATAKVLDANGSPVGTGTIYQPFLAKVGSSQTPAAVLQPGSFAFGKGARIAFSSVPATPVVGYYDGSSWVTLNGSSPASYEVTTDQNGVSRGGSNAVGSVVATASGLCMLKVNSAANGTVSGGTVYGDVYPLGTTVTLTAIPSSGYRVTEWDYVLGGSGVASTANPLAITLTTNVTLIPVFSVYTGFTISYSGNGNTGGTVPSAQAVNSGGNTNISGAGTMVKSRNSFSGWNTRSDGTGTDYAPGVTYSGPENLNLYAKWALVPSPSISVQPTSQTVFAGSNVTFSVAATGTAPLAYQWQLNGANISSATATNYSIPGVMVTNAGNYTVVVSNSGGSITSSVALLTVNKATPSVTTWPASTAITYGQTLAASSLSGGSASVVGSFAFITPSTVPSAGTASQAVTFTPTDTANYTSVSGSVSVMVNKVAATVALADLSQTYSATARSATATTTPAGLTVNLTYNGSAIAPIHVGNYTVIGAISDVNYSGSVTNTLVIGKAAATVSLANLSQTYSATARRATATTTPTRLMVNLTYDGSAIAPINVGNYTVIGTISDVNYSGSVTNTLMIGKAAATVALANLSQTYSGSARAVTCITTPAGLTVNLTYNGSANAATNAGSYLVIGTIADINYAGSATNTLVVSPAAGLVSLNNLAQSYNGSARSVTVGTAPAGLPVSVTYNGSVSAPVNAGNYTVVALVTNPNYTGGATNTLAVSQASQTIDLALEVISSIPLNQFTNPIAVIVEASSGLPVTLTLDTNSAATLTETNTLVNIGQTGTIILRANQTGNVNYTAATEAVVTLDVTKASQTISFSPIADQVATNAALTLTATSDSGLTVSYSVVSGSATVSGSTLTLTGAGVVTVATDQSGNTNFNAAATVSRSFNVTMASQSIAFGPLPDQIFGNAPFSLTATASSSLAVDYVSSDTSVASISGSTVTIIGAGMATITASQSGNAYYAAAANVSQTLNVNPATSSINLGNLSQTYDGTAKSVTVLSPTNLVVVVTYDGWTNAPTNAGSYTVIGTIPDPNYTGGATNTLTVNQATPSVTIWPAASALIYGQTLADSILSGGDASVAGTFGWTTPGTWPVAGTTLQGVTFTPADAVDYNSVTGAASVVVLPTVTTEAASGLTTGGATLNAAINPNGNSVDAHCQYATTTTVSGGTTVSTLAHSGLTGTNSENVNLSVTGLVMQTTYYYRALATNSLGTVTGEMLSFTTPVTLAVAITNAQQSGASDLSVSVSVTVPGNYQLWAVDNDPVAGTWQMLVESNTVSSFTYTVTNALTAATTRFFRTVTDNAGVLVTNQQLFVVHNQPTQTGQWYKLSLPLDLGDANTLALALGAQLKGGLSGDDVAGDLLYVMDAKGNWLRYDLDGTSTWTSNGVPTTDTVANWQGFWLKRRSTGPAQTNAIYAGSVQTNDLTVTFRSNAWQMIAWPYASPWREDDGGGTNKGWGFAAAGAQKGNSYNNADDLMVGSGATAAYYFLNTDGRWYQPGVNVPATNATLRAFEGYYYMHRGTGFVWSVKNP